jgi:hypothetical protein
MKPLIIAAIVLLSSTSAWAQQRLDDPRYVYSLDAQNHQAYEIALNISERPRASFLYKGKLYKDVDYTSFVYDSALVYHEIRPCFSRREKKQLTKERGIKMLYVVGEYSTTKKLLIDHPEYRNQLK